MKRGFTFFFLLAAAFVAAASTMSRSRLAGITPPSCACRRNEAEQQLRDVAAWIVRQWDEALNGVPCENNL